MVKIKLDTNNIQETFKLDYVGKEANGCVWYECGGSVLLATVCAQKQDKQEDFLPLSVQYIQKAYAGGKIPSGFIKREGKLSESEILISRIIDRTIRPLFPKDYYYDTCVVIYVLSYDGKSDLVLNALNAVCAALYVSNIPVDIAACGLRIGRIDNEFIINPTATQLRESSIDLFVAGQGYELLMIEFESLGSENTNNELSEELLIEALELAKTHIANATNAYKNALSPHKKQAFSLESNKTPLPDSILKAIESKKEAIELAISSMALSERSIELEKIINELINEFSECESSAIRQEVELYKRNLVRNKILDSGIRADGRALDEVRDISIETNILPFVHGSALFTRGQTQVLVTATLGGENDAQSYEILGSNAINKDRFLFHYNFPAFSVGESAPIGSVGRRELGHGNLAKKALKSSIKNNDKTIRLVSETLQSNGSSSMASVCGGSLALYACGIESHSLIAGVAMGLIKNDDKFAILSDISGLEDHDGDMDFKVAGGFQGISAMQLDIKLGGISKEILIQVLAQAKKAKLHILEKMQQAKNDIVLNEAILPKSVSFFVPPYKIAEIIGQGGKVIREIIDRFKVSIDLAKDSGKISINSDIRENIHNAKEFIQSLVEKDIAREYYEVGQIFSGKVKRVVDFGVFVEMPNGLDGLLHISKIPQDLVQNLSSLINTNLECQVLSINKGKIELGLK